MAVNSVTVIGNLGAYPQVHALPSGRSVVNLSLATSERFTDRDGGKQDRTEWHRIVAFGKLAETCARCGRAVCAALPVSLPRREPRLPPLDQPHRRAGPETGFATPRFPCGNVCLCHPSPRTSESSAVLAALRTGLKEALGVIEADSMTPQSPEFESEVLKPLRDLLNLKPSPCPVCGKMRKLTAHCPQHE